MSIVDLTGQRFDALVALEFSHKNKHGRPMWKCACDCGVSVVVNADNLKSGNSKSCGCRKRRARPDLSERMRTHGLSKTPDYGRWSSMLDRCYLPTHHAYSLYGGRGITVCQRWHSFENYLEDMGHRPAGMSLDRVDNDGPYSPENCRWATQKEQVANRRNPWLTRRSNYTHEFCGESRTIREWAEYMGCNKTTLYRKLAGGASLDSVLRAS